MNDIGNTSESLTSWHLKTGDSGSPLLDTKSVDDDDDMSFSELSISTQPVASSSRRFSLFARKNSPQYSNPTAIALDIDRNIQPHQSVQLEGEDHGLQKQQWKSTKSKEDRLKHDLFILKKLNDAFARYNDALRDTKTSTEHIAMQLEQTNALLDKYTSLLAKTETATRLIFDEQWHGGDNDIAILKKERREEIEKLKHEEEQRRLASMRDLERTLREEQEARERSDADRKEKTHRKAVGSLAVRGVRGTGASLRAAGTTRGRGRGSPSEIRGSRGSRTGSRANSARPETSARAVV